ncbi:MAG: hypothetical protein ACKVPY_14650 [Paracoccaceae bacterium]
MAGQLMIGLYAGAHFTGAETLNRYLSSNRAALEGAGYGVVAPPAAFDTGWADAPLPGAGTAVPDIGGFAAGLTRAMRPHVRPDAAGLVLSRPDLPGTAEDLLAGRFFPAAGLRGMAMRMALGRPVDTLVFALQPYDLFFMSAWRRASMENDVGPFEDHTRTMSRFAGGWVETVEALADTLGAGRVVVTASAPQDLRFILPYLMPGADLSAAAMPDAAPPITDSAIAMFQRHLRMGTRFAPGQKERLLAFHARLPQTKPRSGFDWLPLADMRGRYVGDLDMLARMSGVEVIGTPMTAIAAE